MAPQRANTNAMNLNAVEALTQQLIKANEHLDQFAARFTRQDEQSHAARTVEQIQAHNQQERAARLASAYPGVADLNQTRPAPQESGGRRPSLGQRWQDATTPAEEGGKKRGPLEALGTFAPPMPGALSDTASVPQGQRFGSPTSNMTGMGSMSGSDALTWAVLGEHGGPAPIRNIALQSYGLQRSIGWAQNAATQVQQQVDAGSQISKIPGVNEKTLRGVRGATQLASDHPLATYAAYTAGSKALGGIRSLGGAEQMGASLGDPTSPERYFLGMRNPLSPLLSGATSVGAGAEINKQQLEGRLPGGGLGGWGLSSQQATQAINQIAGQGFGGNETKFGGGDIGAISNQFFGPLMKQYPGLNAADLGQFLPYLRQSGTSLQQLRGSLTDLGEAARATHETIGQATTAMVDFNQQTQGMGSLQGGLNTAQSFRSVTGMDPQIAGQLMQSPMVKGMAISQYGVLPSGLRDIPGLSNSLMTQSVNRLMQATQGLNRDRTVIDPTTGQKVKIDGRQMQMDQVAQMLGVDPKIVKQMVGDQKGNTARNRLSEALDSSGGFKDMTQAHGGKLSPAEQKAADQYWQQHVAGNWRDTGISQKDMERISREPVGKRSTDLRKAISTASGSDSWNQVQQNANSQTVNVKFTGAAAKFFEQAGPTTAKRAANTGKMSIGGIQNSILGDAGTVAADAAGTIIGGPTGAVVRGLADLFS